MKTAMQELIDELKYQFSHSDNHLQTIVNIVQKAQDELLEKEKEQIMEAYKNSINTILLLPSGIKSQKGNSEDYYNRTYNNF